MPARCFKAFELRPRSQGWPRARNDSGSFQRGSLLVEEEQEVADEKHGLNSVSGARTDAH